MKIFYEDLCSDAGKKGLPPCGQYILTEESSTRSYWTGKGWTLLQDQNIYTWYDNNGTSVLTSPIDKTLLRTPWNTVPWISADISISTDTVCFFNGCSVLSPDSSENFFITYRIPTFPPAGKYIKEFIGPEPQQLAYLFASDPSKAVCTQKMLVRTQGAWTWVWQFYGDGEDASGGIWARNKSSANKGYNPWDVKNNGGWGYIYNQIPPHGSPGDPQPNITDVSGGFLLYYNKCY
tara:strand:+ start:578 stop:1282 length:705 start_codon:yes stop_codon:yes gene_type:complete